MAAGHSIDFDIFAPEFVRDPYPVYDRLRAETPVAYTERWGGQWIPTRYADIEAITRDTDHFSSITVSVVGPKPGEGPLLIGPPATLDPPIHGEVRRLLLPAFSVAAIKEVEPLTRTIVRELIADLAARADGRVDAATDFAQHVPVRVIAAMLGIPVALEATFTDWVDRILKVGADQPEVLNTAAREVRAYFAGLVDERRADPGPPDDLITYLIGARIDGAPLDRKYIIGILFVLLLAGIDTTWSSIGSSLWHLASHPADRERLLVEPELLPTAIEELLRLYSPATMARIVREDTEIDGVPVFAGQRVLLPFPSANRDPEVFDRPHEAVLDREINRHSAFGLGIHRCLGSNLARMELRVALEEWLVAFPSFGLDPDLPVTWTGGQIRSAKTLPLVVGR